MLDAFTAFPVLGTAAIICGLAVLAALANAVLSVNNQSRLKPCRACRTPIEPAATRCPACQIDDPHLAEVGAGGLKVMRSDVPTPPAESLGEASKRQRQLDLSGATPGQWVAAAIIGALMIAFLVFAWSQL